MTEKTELSRYKQQATHLRTFLKEGGMHIKQTHALEAVAKMHGFPNYNTMKAAASPSGPVTTAHNGSMLDITALLDRALDAAIKIDQDDERISTAHRVMGELSEWDDMGGTFDPAHDVAMLAAVIAMSPLVPFAMLDMVRFVTPSDADSTPYAKNAGWFRRILTRTTQIIAVLDAQDGNERVRAMELRDGMLLDEAMCGAAYAVALCALERGDWPEMARCVEIAADFLPIEDERMQTAAIMAWLALGNYERAIEASVTDFTIRINGQSVEDVLEDMAIVAHGGTATALVEKALHDGGFARRVVRCMRSSPQFNDAFFVEEENTMFNVPTRSITSAIGTDVAAAFALAALKDAPVAAWFERVASGGGKVRRQS